MNFPQIGTIAIQLGFIWTMFGLATEGRFGDPESVSPWAILVSLILKPLTSAVTFARDTKGFNEIQRHRCKSYIFITMWKILLTFVFMLAFTYQYMSPSELLDGTKGYVWAHFRFTLTMQITPFGERFWRPMAHAISGLAVSKPIRWTITSLTHSELKHWL